MKYPGGGHQSTMFVEQVGTVTALFDQWNDCERTVVLYALLKRLPFSNLKFLQLSIEYNIAQNINSYAGGSQTTTSNNSAANNGKQQQQSTAANNTNQYGGGSNFNKFHLLESNSNNGIFLTKLISVYKNFRPQDLGQPPPPLDGTGRVPVVYGIGNVPYETKEDILQDILTYLPLLKPGNEEAKSAYISLVPIVVADSIKQLVPTDIVQQILSYLLIHPAVTSEDRRSLAQWLHHLEEHINSSYIDAGAMTSGSSTPATLANNPKMNNRIGSFAVTANKVSGGLPFAAINETGPMPLNCWDGNGSRSASCGTKLGGQSLPHTNSDMPNILWNTDLPQIAPKSGSQDYICDDHVIREFRKTIGRNMDGSATTTALVPILKSASSSLTSCKSTVSSASSSASSTSSISSSSGKAGSGSMALVGSSSSAKDSPAVFVAHPPEATATGSAVATEQEDLHVSFSKNGTEILDFDCDDDNKSNTQIAFEAPPPPINPRMVADAYLAVPHHLDNCFCGSGTPSGQCVLLISTNALKTRRSNSLTTAPVTVAYPGGQGTSSSSTENLLQLKPRSYSLSIESHRGSLISGGSEEMKPSGLLKMGGGNPGMNCIGQWLKSLRLHKYVWLFSNITYEQMMDISEEYLANLSVTKGARHKLVLCIQKLKERGSVLLQMEQTLLAGETHVAPLLEELTNIVLTPMKPIDPFSKDNVAGLFIKVVEMVGSILVSRPIQGPNDEEHVTAFLWILERALHNEAFLGQMNLLKELKFKVSKIKLQFVNKPHFGKGIGSVGVGGGGGVGVVVVGAATAGVTSSINKARWQGTTAKKPNTTGVILSQPPPVCVPGLERKNSGPPLPSFSAMVQSVGQQQQPSQLHLNNLDEKNYFNALAGKVVLGGGTASPQQQQQQYSKSSSYPSFSQNLKFSNPHLGHPSIVAAQNKGPAPPSVVQHQMEPLSKGGPTIFNSNSANHHHQQQQQMTSLCNNGIVGVGGGNGGGNTIYHRHSMNSLMPGNVGHSLVGLTTTTTTPASDKKVSISGGGGLRQPHGPENNENIDIGNQCKDKNNICDINSRLEFLCLQMTEQAIN